MTGLTNKVAVVTGGAAGIGAAVCRFLARDGADIAIWDWNADAARGAGRRDSRMGRKVVVCEVDVSRKNDIDSCGKDRAQGTRPRSESWSTTPPLSPEKDFVDITVEDWDRVFDVNMKGLFLCTQAVIDDMIDARWGRIINISSSSAQSGARRMVHYAATKGGVIAFTKSLAQEVGAPGITVNNVPPSSVYTDGLKSVEARLPGGIEGYT